MIELKLITSFPQEIIAIDEVGRSPLCGPVVIGGLRLKVESYESLITLLRSLRQNGVKDSKELGHENRQDLLEKFQIKEMPFRTKGNFTWKGIELTTLTWDEGSEVIDKINIFEALMLGMKEVALALASPDRSQTTILLDGHCRLRKGEWNHTWNEINIIKGDVKSSLIGLAAIIAKEKRDNYMRGMDVLYPGYNLASNFGYPTKAHREAIERLGPCPIHRKTFSKVKEFVHPLLSDDFTARM